VELLARSHLHRYKEQTMLELQVENMTCGHCVKAVTQAVTEVDPQAKVDVDLASKTVKVDSGVDPAHIRLAIAEAGYPVSGPR
jgi:copper chaperone